MVGMQLAPLAVWARAETRRRWAGLALLGALAGLAAGLTIAAVGGIDRTDTAYDRMREELHAADVVFFPSQVAALVDVTELSAMPEVAAWGSFSATFSQLVGLPEGEAPFITQGDWFNGVEGAKVLQGRLPDPTRDDEAVITEPALHSGYDIGVGSVLRWVNPDVEQTLAGFDGTLPVDFDIERDGKGPVTDLHVVGVVRLPMESVVSFASEGLMFTSPAWAEQHLDETLPYFTNAVVRLRNGAADIPAFQARVAETYGRADLPVKDLAQDIKRVQGSLDVERTALLLFAIAVGLAGVVLVGQSMARSARAGAESASVLSAMGLTRRALVAGSLIPFAVTALAALVTAAIASIVFSARFPIGLARQLDPSLGVRVDAGELAVGLLVLLAALLLGAALTSMIAIRAQTRHNRELPRARTAGAVVRAGGPVPIAVGASLAIESGPQRGGSVRPALLAATIGVFGVVGATAIVYGIDDAAAHRARTGAVWDAELVNPAVPTIPPERTQSVLDSGQVDELSMVTRHAAAVNGYDAPIYALEPLRGELSFTVLSGRAPSRQGEVALGPPTADHLGVGIGDMVTVGPTALPMRVTGITLLVQTPHSAFDEGAWITQDDMDLIALDVGDDLEQIEFIGLADGATVQDVAATVPDMLVSEPTVANDVVNLTKVRRLPYALAAFLVVLAIGAVAHTLLSGSRRRHRELAVLRALGLTPRQSAACVGWQAVVIGAIAVLIGIPLGALIGRQVWRLITDRLSFVYQPPFDAAVVLIAVPVVVITLALLAAWPARAAARLRTAQVLRTE